MPRLASMSSFALRRIFGGGSKRAIGFSVKQWPKGSSCMKRLTAAWLRKAEGDLEVVRKIRASPPPQRDETYFHCQQAAEKLWHGSKVGTWRATPERSRVCVTQRNA